GGGEHVAGVGQLLARYRAAGDQAFAALHVGARLLDRDLARAQFGLGGVGAAEVAAHLAHGRGQVGHGLVVGDLGVVRIQLHQHLAGLDAVAVVDLDADHGAGGLGHHAHHVALGIGVVGVLVPARVHQVPG